MQKIRFSVFIIIAIIIYSSCAKISSPQGGPKDTDAPKILASEPVNKATGFTGKKIAIEFDEFIQINNLPSVFSISPPLKEKPEFKLKGKSLIIDLNNELNPNSTYTLSFGDGICDLNENNPYKNFQFVFSTGSSIDTMQISGFVVDAVTNTAADNITVMLYENHSDSAPLKQIPAYAVKTQKDGSFIISNIKKTNYKIFALKDANNNYLFDQPTERIAFSDSLFYPESTTVQKTDTLRRLNKPDSIIKSSKTIFKPDNVKLYLFEEDNKKQYITNNDWNDPNFLRIVFSTKLNKEPEVKIIDIADIKKWCFTEINAKKDTVLIFITDTTVANKKSIKLLTTYERFDNANNISTIVTDTLEFKQQITKQAKSNKASKRNFKASASTLLDSGEDLLLTNLYPVSKIDTSLVILNKTEVAATAKEKTEFFPDLNFSKLTNGSSRHFRLKTNWSENSNYKLILLPGAIVDIYGNKNDTVKLEFKTQSKENYGNLIFKFRKIKENTIFQLTDNRDKIIKEFIFNKDTEIKIEKLLPDKYKGKLITDRNNNNKWDTGKYMKKQQPEKISHFKDEITIRAGWDLDLEWITE